MKNFFTTKRICRAAIIAALYATVSIVFAPITSGEFQCRLSEALTVLPLFFPEAIAGLAIGCLLTNLLVGNGILDVVLGTLATLLAAVTTFVIGRAVKKSLPRLILAELPPILYNAFLVPVTFIAFLTAEELKDGYLLYALWVGLGQLAAVGIAGSILYFAVDRLQRKGVPFFTDKQSESGKSFSPLSAILTFGSILPAIGAIAAYMTIGSYNPVSTSLAVLSVLVLVICTLARLFNPEKE